MKIVNIIGGLGNQMFQYAFALSLQERFPNEKILIDISHFNYFFIKKWGAANLHNGYEIDKIYPNVTLEKANAGQLLKVTRYIPNYLLSRVARRILPQRKTEIVQSSMEYFAYDSTVYNKTGNCYYEGIWESISYYLPIREKILYAFQHPHPNDINAQYIKQMEMDNSVGIHIRRGDYLQSETFKGICDLTYYQKAIAEIRKDNKRHSFYIFSNDMKWCEENIRPCIGNDDLFMVKDNSGSDSCWDMFLMTHCKDLIMANSSFSWWGAFLNNRGGKVIAPNKWANRNTVFDIWAPNWIKL